MRPWVPDAPRRARRGRDRLPPSLVARLRRPGRPDPGAARSPSGAAPPAHGRPETDPADLRLRIARARAAADPETPLRASIAEALGEGTGPTDALCARLEDDLAGFGPLTRWVRTAGVTDVLVDGRGQVWTDGADGLTRRPARLDPETARTLAVRLLGRAGRRLDAAVPLADARVDGVRVHAVLPPVSGGGTTLSLRVPTARTRSLAELAATWPDGEVWADLVRRLVRAHATVLVSGATGTGKTTLLSAALGEVGHDERIVTVEDTLEAAPEHPHVIALQCRSANEEGAGEVTLPELIRQALRMRPDRLVVGECRGAEVTDLLTALNTGHQGAWGTLHANSAGDVPARLAAMAALAGWPREAVDAQARAGVDAVLHVVRDRHGRHPVQLAAPAPGDGPVRLLEVLTWEDGPDGGRSVAGPGRPALDARLAGRERP